VLEAVQQYARGQRIPCKKSGAAAIECWWQPVRIWAVADGQATSVCYAAMGIPLEARKFDHRMNELESLIRDRVGSRVAVVASPCPTPPLHLNMKDVEPYR